MKMLDQRVMTIGAIALAGCSDMPNAPTLDASGIVDCTYGCLQQVVLKLNPVVQPVGPAFVDKVIPLRIGLDHVDPRVLADLSSLSITSNTSPGGTPPLPFELEPQDAPTVIWVRVPAVLGAFDNTTLTVSYGGAAVTRSPESVWPSTFWAVWHLDSSATIQSDVASPDGMRHDATVTGSPVVVDGALGKGLDLSRNAYLDVLANLPAADLEGPYTLSAWVWLPDLTAPAQGAITQHVGDMPGIDAVYLGLENRVPIGNAAASSDATLPSLKSTHGQITAGRWTQLVFTSDADVDSLYVDGIQHTSTHPEDRPERQGKTPLIIGNTPIRLGGKRTSTAVDLLGGALDEVRIERVARSSGEVAFDFIAQIDAVATYAPPQPSPRSTD